MLAALNKYLLAGLAVAVVALGVWSYITSLRLDSAQKDANSATQQAAASKKALDAYVTQAKVQATAVVAASKVRSATSAKATTILTRSDSERTAETVAADARDVSQLWESQDEVAAD